MMDLEGQARALLELARDADDPTAADRARVQAALAARLGAAAGLGLAAGLGSAAKAAAATSAGVGAGTLGVGAAAKLVSVAVLASVGVGAGVTAIRRAHHAPAASVAIAKPALLAPRVVPAAPEGSTPAKRGDEPLAKALPPEVPRGAQPTPPVRAPTRVSLPAPPPVTAPAAPAPLPVNAAAGQSGAGVQAPDVPESRNAVATVPAHAPGFGLADEAQLIHTAVVALRSGKAAQALALFDAHANFYPHGVLAEERDAERALALADLGRTAEARAAIERFLGAHPASPLAARLRERKSSLAGP